MYHFRITGPGRYQFTAEAFAGRIGSPLNAALTLFRLVNGELTLVHANNDSYNPATSSDGLTVPLYTDPVLFAGLAAGEYFLAVTSSPNVSNPNEPWSPGPNPDGIFDPITPHSGKIQTGLVGRYVLNLGVTPDNVRPRVTSVSISDGSTLIKPPTTFTVTFSEAVNLQLLAGTAYDTYHADPRAVFFEADDGTRYIPRLMFYDPDLNRAEFMILDALSNGVYKLRLSANEGLSDFAGNRLIGNDPSGDYVITFTAAVAMRDWTSQEPNDTLEDAQDLGVLFPREVEA
jgi:hypothetical protein